MNKIIAAFGGRKYFWCAFWCAVATVLLAIGKIQSFEWVGLISWFFSNVVIANNREAVAAIKQGGINDQIN